MEFPVFFIAKCCEGPFLGTSALKWGLLTSQWGDLFQGDILPDAEPPHVSVGPTSPHLILHINCSITEL